MSAAAGFEWSPCEGVPDKGTPVQTACGGTVNYSPAVPCVNIRGENIYFCLPACKADFESDPENSCLAVYIQQMDQGGNVV